MAIMDPRSNPYAPGAGYPPPELAGRDDIVERASIALDRIRAGRPARSMVFYGLRGVGKTVLLNKVRLDAESRGIVSAPIEALEDRSLPGILAPTLRSALLGLDRIAAFKSQTRAALGALAGFVRAFKVKYQDIEVTIDAEHVKGVADSGDLEHDLAGLVSAVGEAARANSTAVLLSIDELQYIREEELASLIFALHRANQRQLPVALVAAGLPQLLGQMGRAKSYAERLFEFVPVDRLDARAATDALRKPAQKEGVDFVQGAIDEILEQTRGYPYFLQEWGKHSWNIADASPIEPGDAVAATQSALAELDASFFRVRFDRLTPAEKRYMRAMAELGPGPHRSGEIADLLGKRVTAVAPMRNKLISKGMIYSPSHGDTAFTVPLFDGFMKRTMPWPQTKP